LPRSARERLIVALDLPTEEEAVALTRRIGDDVLWVKVGLELFCSSGPSVVHRLVDLGKRVFLDLKFHDIPNTVAGAIRSASRLPVSLLTMHAAAGERALEAAGRLQVGRDQLGVLAVTRLTSDAEDLPGFADVVQKADAAARAGVFGVVCPAGAARILREVHGDRLARVVPGIRLAGSGPDDQVHIATPKRAVEEGAHWIVVGRTITRSPQPSAAAAAIIHEMEEAQGR